MIGDKRTFVANDIDGIAAVFSDHELIQSLGCESVVNVLIVVGAARSRAPSTACTRPVLHARAGRGRRGAEAARRALPAAQRTDCQGRLTMAGKTIRVATDVGGTFTDLVCFETEPRHRRAALVTASPTPRRRISSAGVLNVLEKGGVDPKAVDFLAHGTTVVINALTERKGVKVGLITTEAFERIELRLDDHAPRSDRYARHRTHLDSL